MSLNLIINNNDFTKYVNAAFDLSVFTSMDRIKAFLAIPSQGILDNDPLYSLSNNMLTHFNSKSDEIAKAQNSIDSAAPFEH